MPIIDHADQAGIYRIAARFVEQALRADGSLHTRVPVWTPANIDALSTRFAERLDGASGRFDDRWATLLEGASPTVRQLAAEVMGMHVLFAADLAPATKRRLVETSDPRFVLSPGLTRALEAGVTSTGVAFKAARLSQLWFVVRAASAWKRLRAGEQRSALADPDAFKTWLATVAAQGGQPQREALLHLLFPEAFEPIVSVGVKSRIAEAFTEYVPAGTEDVDVALRYVREALERVHGRGFWFTDPLLAARWQIGS